VRVERVGRGDCGVRRQHPGGAETRSPQAFANASVTALWVSARVVRWVWASSGVVAAPASNARVSATRRSSSGRSSVSTADLEVVGQGLVRGSAQMLSPAAVMPVALMT
jgi:hypothetical protein